MQNYWTSFDLFQPNFGNGYHYTAASDNMSSGRDGRTGSLEGTDERGPQPAEWTNIIPTIEDSDRSAASQIYKNSFSYTGNFVFYGLIPSTDYEVIIQSRNKEGWSNASDIFRFSTRSRGKGFSRLFFATFLSAAHCIWAKGFFRFSRICGVSLQLNKM